MCKTQTTSFYSLDFLSSHKLLLITQILVYYQLYLLSISKDGCHLAELSSIPEESQRPKIEKKSEIYFIDIFDNF